MNRSPYQIETSKLTTGGKYKYKNILTTFIIGQDLSKGMMNRPLSRKDDIPSPKLPKDKAKQGKIMGI